MSEQNIVKPKTSMIRNDNYITIQGFMVNELELKGNELLVYAIIYGFSQTDNQTFNGSLQYLADWTNSSKYGVQISLKKLLEKGYIKKNEKYINGVKFVSYFIPNLSMQQSCMVCNKVGGGMQQSCINNIKYNIEKEIDNNKLLSTKKDKFIPPTLEEVVAYCQERNKGVDGYKVYDYYSSNDWKDSKGSPIKNWKQKIIGVWEKEEKNTKQQVEEYNPYDLVQDEDGAFIFRGDYDRQRRA